MKKIISVLFLLISFNFIYSESLSIDLYDTEIPIPLQEEQREIIVHDYYTLSYREVYEQAEWVMYIMQKSGNAKRKDNFRSDPLVSTKSATPNDYKNSGYDKGHLAPAADFNINDEAMSQTFFMSNMSPQTPYLNRYSWKELEAYFRDLSEKFDKVYIITGPVLGTDDEVTVYNYIGNSNNIAIPEFYYKCGLFIKDSGYYMLGYILPNLNVKTDFQEYQTTVDEIESLINLDLFAFLDDEIENELEKSIIFIE